MLQTKDLGDSANTTALTTYNCGELEDVYVTVDGTFSATGTVECSFDNGTTWDVVGSTTAAQKLVGPLPGNTLVRGKNSARASGTVKYRLGGNKARDIRRLPVREVKEGKGVDITSAAASTAVNVADLDNVKVTLIAANFVGTYAIKVSFDGGTTWGIHTTAAVASGATLTTVTLPRSTAINVEATAFTSGTLAWRYAGQKESVV
jgi:hypothetical protein